MGPNIWFALWMRPSWLPKIRPESPPEGLEGMCLIWLGTLTHDGYPRVRTAGGRKGSRLVYLHRLVLEHKLGADALVGFDADHMCSRRACIQELHLQKLTHQENLDRSSFYAHTKGKAMIAKLSSDDWAALADTSWVPRSLGYA